VIPSASWGPEKVIPRYGKRVKLFPRTKLSIKVGDPVDLSPWRGMAHDNGALEEASEAIMKAITVLLEELRGEKAPAVRFDTRKTDLPRIGNFNKKKRFGRAT